MKGKPWSIEEERQLRSLAAKGMNAAEIGIAMSKKPNSIYEKAKRLGLIVHFSRKSLRKSACSIVGGCAISCGQESNAGQPSECAENVLKSENGSGSQSVSTSESGIGGFRLGENGGLPSIEEALKVLVYAENKLAVPGLCHDETLRLRSMINGIKIYKELFADYVNYKAMEKQMIDMEAKYTALLSKTTNVQ